MKPVIIRKNNIQIQGVTGRAVDPKEVTQMMIDRMPKSGGWLIRPPHKWVIASPNLAPATDLLIL